MDSIEQLEDRITELETTIGDLGYRIEQMENDTDLEDRLLVVERTLEANNLYE